VRATVVIPTRDARALLLDALASLARQTVDHDVVVVDNASSDGTAEAVEAQFPHVRLVRNDENLGFGRAVNRGVETVDTPVVILVNNDVVCEPDFVQRMLEPFSDDEVGLVAGVLLQHDAPELVDSAGIELDPTLRSWDRLWNRPASELTDGASPLGPCGGAAAYRTTAWREVGGFDDAFFAYWEDVDLALRLRLAGWRCVFAGGARVLHEHGQTLGAASPAQRRLEAFGRGFVLARYRVGGLGLITKMQIAALDWPVLGVHLLFRRETGPIRERLRGRRVGLARPPLRPPVELAAVSFSEALARQAHQLTLRFSGRLPEHFRQTGDRASADH
jgi:N-acetylglucosaminyl-diphospho-decaprenol L-rhamnosyltransferase